MKNVVVLLVLLTLIGCKRETEKNSVFQMRLVESAPSHDTEQMIYEVKYPAFSKTNYETIYAQKSILLGDSMVKSATVVTGLLGEAQINLTLMPSGQRRLAEVTQTNVGRRIAVIVDGQIVSVPTVIGMITNESTQIVGEFSGNEAKFFVEKINKSVNN